MYYILGGAYKGLLFALYLKNLGNKIVIVTYIEDIIKYCVAENIDYIKFEKIRPTVAAFYKVFALKKMLDNVIKEIDIGKENRFFLLSDSNAYDAFYLAKELSKKTKGYYKLTDGRLKIYKPPRFKPIFFRGAIIRFTLKLVLGLDLMYYRRDKKNPCFGVDDKFLKKYNIMEYAPDADVEELTLDAVKKYKSNHGEYENFIIDDGLLTGYVNFDSMKKLYKDLFELPLKFAFKKHPNLMYKKTHSELYLSFYKEFKNCKEIPAYVPAELLFNNIKKNVISIFSTALITASRLQHLKTISLLELVEWYDKSYKKEWKERLIATSNNKILFPNNFEELKEILLR